MQVSLPLKSNTFEMRFFFSFILLSFFLTDSLEAQEIDFGTFTTASVTLAQLNPAEDLDFGLLVSNNGVASIGISNSVVFTLTGVRFLDVILDVSADDNLTLDGLPCGAANCMIPFTLEAAYANLGSDNIGQARVISVASNFGSAQFPILRRNDGPPGPPPTPNFVGFDPSAFNSTAYIYIYGSINVGNVDAGNYEGQITISVNYD